LHRKNVTSGVVSNAAMQRLHNKREQIAPANSGFGLKFEHYRNSCPFLGRRLLSEVAGW
jgi:hypothetical protein